MTLIQPSIKSVEDPSLRASIVSREPLVYDEGASESEDRPAHVRAASAVRYAAGKLFVFQDDANFIGVRCADEGDVSSIALPRGEGGRRRFEKALGNKADKLDLEAAVLVDGPDGGRLLAFGSGSTFAREHIVDLNTHTGALRVVQADELYAMLRRQTSFSGSELNVEGAVADDERLVLFQRANGAPRDGLEPVNATMDLDLGAFLEWLDVGGALPYPKMIRQYDLGEVDDVLYGFTDAARLPGGEIVFLAGAEDSPDTYHDGEVLGCRMGLLDGDQARHTTLLDEDGEPSTLKVEGIAIDADRPTRAWLVTDMDEPQTPAMVCTVQIEGFG